MASIYWPITGLFTLWWGSGFIILFSKRRGTNLDSKKYRLPRWLYHEIKPFAIALIVIILVFCPYPFPSNATDTLFNLWLWWSYKDVDKDDRWKKRLDKAKSKVKISHNRLVVVPVRT